jgi:2-polyprenyl-3-methyl-5-hydroxy-6-metoxy-1,4-benzoquinol methylase
MPPSHGKQHWDKVYATTPPDRVSWYRPHLEISLSLIERAAGGRSAAIIDVGGGESTLVDDLLRRGYQNLTLLDISQTAIDVAKERLKEKAQLIRWIAADITRVDLPPDTYDVWHDRAVFHFLTSPEHRAAYVRTVVRSVKRGGHVIVATFGPEGPTRCSGLEVARYDPESLHHEFGVRFQLMESAKELHQTPFAKTQQFVYCFCRRE